MHAEKIAAAVLDDLDVLADAWPPERRVRLERRRVEAQLGAVDGDRADQRVQVEARHSAGHAEAKI